LGLQLLDKEIPVFCQQGSYPGVDLIERFGYQLFIFRDAGIERKRLYLTGKNKPGSTERLLLQDALNPFFIHVT
jgi:hypothetical protein